PTQFGFHDPVRALRRARARGLKLIVVDPRGSETARQADLFLQPYPGEDAALMAGLLHIVLGEGWEDADFCRRYLQPLGPLRVALAPFTPAKVAARTGVEEEHLRRAASLFARDSRRGMAGSGTGPDMGPHSNLAEHLIQVLNLVCGRFLREGELVPNPGVLGPRIPRRAQPVAGVREWETSRRSRAGGLGSIRGEMMSARLADEILSPGEDRIRALICVGGNPAVALPDQVKAVAALRSLELFVAVDPRLSASARLAHYVLPPLLPYERPDQTSFLERFFRTPYAQFTPALVAPPSDSDLVDDWYVFWRLAAELGISLQIGGVALPTARPPDRMELLALLARKAQVPYEAVRATAGGRIHDVPPQVVEAGDPATPPLDVMPSDVASELRGLAGDADPGRGGFRLIVRRQRSLMNSTLSDAPAVRARLPQNPLYMHLDDMSALGVGQGDLVVVTRGPGRRIRAPVCADPQLRRGVVALSHGWGPPASGPGPLGGIELATNLLVDDELGVEAINAMPVMTAIPVTVEPLGDSS
ncbi:MAG: nitrate reductase, partial [Phenylobacterium sp.]|nr:nitrate reductase [Phenylobacterium sp.]